MRYKSFDVFVGLTWWAGLVGWALLAAPEMRAQDPEADPVESRDIPDRQDEIAKPIVAPELPQPFDLKPLAPDYALWIDVKRKAVVARGQVSMRDGPLEMFACPRNTKEYESVVAVDAPAYQVHAALLAIGLKPGHPVRFRPKYVAVTGPVVRVDVFWKQEGQWQTAKAQDWVRDSKTKAAMTYDWVFGGSGFWTDPDTGEKFYYAEGGELICVSNFATATLDLPVPSPQLNSELWFSAFTERIPDLGTEVYLVMRPKAADETTPAAGNP